MEPIDKSYLILLGMVAGFTSIYLGYKLFLKGIDGSASFEGEIKKVKLSLRNAAPGLFFALFGASVIVAGIYKQDIHTLQWRDGGRVYIETISKSERDSGGMKNSPDVVRIIFDEAVAYRKVGDFQNAKVLYLALLKVDGSLHQVHNNVANICLAEKNYDTAINYAKEAIRHSETNTQKAAYYDTLSRIYNGQGNYRNAVDAIKTAVQLDPSDRDYKAYFDELNKQKQGGS
jgi:tetratricopeptide (TPR) repeat protein